MEFINKKHFALRSLSNAALVRWIFVLCLVALGGGCASLAKKDEMGVIIARRAQVRSSTAVVAADLLEVTRGDTIDILDSQTASDGERWFRVRARDAENTEGWIEARNVMLESLLSSSRQLAEEDKDIAAQAAGQLRASTNLRLTPDRNGNDNILMKLDNGAVFDIVGWKRVPKPKSSETTESDDAPKAGVVTRNSNRGRKNDEELKPPEESVELWYKVRLPRSVSPAPAGWVYGKQVELKVPSDVIFYRTGREFVAWHRLDAEAENASSADTSNNKDAAAESQAGSWVILEKSSSDEPSRVDDPDFDRIFVLGYNKDKQEHYTAYRSPDIKGRLPLRVEGSGNSKTFTVRAQTDEGEKEFRYKVYTDDKGLLRVEPLDHQPNQRK